MTRFKDRRANRRGVADQIRTLIRRAREMVGELDTDTFNRRPAEGGWSVAQCLDHLNASARLYLPIFTEAMDEARAKGHVVTDRTRDPRTWLGRFIAWSQEPPYRIRTKTFEDIEPVTARLEPGDVLDEFQALHEELIVRINEAITLDQRRIRIRSTLDSRLRLTLADWFAFLAAHGRRHLWQAEQTLNRVRDEAS
jgi:hypothetical protein